MTIASFGGAADAPVTNASAARTASTGRRVRIGVAPPTRRLIFTPSPAPCKARAPGSGALEVDEAALDVGALQRHLHSIADVEAVGAAHEAALDGRPRDPHPRALVRGAGDERVETLAEAVLEQQRRRRLPHLALDLRGVVFLLGAVAREGVELVGAVRGPAAGQCRLHEALADQIREAPVRRGGVRVVAHGEREVAGGLVARAWQRVLALAEQLHDGARQVPEALGIG